MFTYYNNNNNRKIVQHNNRHSNQLPKSQQSTNTSISCLTIFGMPGEGADDELFEYDGIPFYCYATKKDLKRNETMKQPQITSRSNNATEDLNDDIWNITTHASPSFSGSNSPVEDMPNSPVNHVSSTLNTCTAIHDDDVSYLDFAVFHQQYNEFL